MEKTALKVALAALMHDIGKFAQNNLEIAPVYRNNNADLYQPFRNGKHTHVHALYTAAFIEQKKDFLPPELNGASWGEGDSFINLAAGHHNPKTPMQWIIAQADRISSGLDRTTFEEGEKIAYKDFQATRLLPVLEALDPDQKKGFRSEQDFLFRYPLKALNPQSIFPEKANRPSSPKEEYRKLFNEFCEELESLLPCEDNIELWTQHFDSLFMEYTALIPAARTGDVVYDVSLYDHSKTTAALAAALYRYHGEMDSMDSKAIQNGKDEKLLLITGDFYGIQGFIFSKGGETAKNRSKLLRGRSFAVSVFSELAADLLCKKLKLPSLCVVLNAAGKFTILAPNTEKSRSLVREAEKEINDWFFDISYGETSMGFAMTPASPDDFEKRFAELWNDRHMGNCGKRKLAKLELERFGVIENYLDDFSTEFSKPLCPFCRKRPSRRKTDNKESDICNICYDHALLGKKLVKKHRLAVLDEQEGPAHAQGELKEKIFGRYQFVFDEPIAEKNVARLWDFGAKEEQGRATKKRINGYVPVYEDADFFDPRLELQQADNIFEIPKNFDDIASLAKVIKKGEKPAGTDALGVLKADIDNLGLIMACGLPENRFTISRLATMSRQLDAFFTVYIPALLSGETGNKDFKNVYTVFAGGDDLFLIGPWNKMAPLAEELKKKFAEYVCDNPKLTFSAGISFHKSHTAVNKMADAANAALDASKEFPMKNAVTMFGSTISWDDFFKLLSFKEVLERWFEDGDLARSMMYRLNYLVELSEKERILQKKGTFAMEDLECLKWRASFWYSLERNLSKNLKKEEREKKMLEIGRMAKWLGDHGAGLRIPLWSMLYDQR